MSPVRVLSLLLIAVFIMSSRASVQEATSDNFGVGDADVFLKKYLAFRDERLKSDNPDLLTISIGYVKGLSRSFTGIAGTVSIDLRTAVFTANVRGLKIGEAYSVWLVDRQEVDGVPLDAELKTDPALKLADILPFASSARLSGTVRADKLPDFHIDRVVIARGTDSAVDILGSGSTSVLQKIFFRRLSLTKESTGRLLLDDVVEAAPPFAKLLPDIAAETEAARTVTPVDKLARFWPSLAADVHASGGGVPLDQLISQGADLFFDKKFSGNGRTCGTCHPASNNFTIDPPFIGTLPADDPLFVAEFKPALAQLEKPQLMRQFGLILENLDGLEDPTNKFVMRSVPHTLGLQVSLQRDTLLTNAPVEMTGWSGDGAPGNGSLRDFAVGAVTQHFTKTLARNEGPDFHLPNEHQLDALEAFQLSLGRDTDFNLGTVTFLDANVESGKQLFINGTGNPNAQGTCSACHGNAGALASFIPFNGQNLNFNTNVEEVVHFARSVQNFPHDGGFGQTPFNPDGTFGNLTFNTPPVVEAADTPPFFHNNVVTTLDGVIDFYTGPEFNNPRAPAARFSFTPAQKTNVVNFMRGINTLQNVNVALRELQEILALNGNPKKEIAARLETALADTNHGITVLNQGAIFPAAVTHLTTAQQFIGQAQQTNNQAARTILIQQAVAELNAAKGSIAP